MIASRVVCTSRGWLGMAVVAGAALVLAAGCAEAPDEAVDIDFVHGPRPRLQLDNGCRSIPGRASCQAAVASPSVLHFAMAVDDWGGSTAGDLQLSDSCGGHISIDSAQPDVIEGTWVPPVAGGPCILRGRAISADGVIGTADVSLFAQPGVAYPTTTLWLESTLRGEHLDCALRPSTPACGAIAAGTAIQLAGDSSDLGAIEIDDSCAGHRRWFGTPSGFSVPPWTVPHTPGMSCKVTVRGTSLSGNVKAIATRYTIGN